MGEVVISEAEVLVADEVDEVDEEGEVEEADEEEEEDSHSVDTDQLGDLMVTV